MHLRRRKLHHQYLMEFERGLVIGLREGGFYFSDIIERFWLWNVSIVHDCWQQWSRKMLSQEYRVKGGLEALLRRKTAVYGI
ncbi:HTH_38 domain-containing protein [Trichonephila clavipes]|nr:HTH_38 domain-containing protein [Trichonephila clavipes]